MLLVKHFHLPPLPEKVNIVLPLPCGWWAIWIVLANELWAELMRENGNKIALCLWAPRRLLASGTMAIGDQGAVSAWAPGMSWAFSTSEELTFATFQSLRLRGRLFYFVTSPIPTNPVKHHKCCCSNSRNTLKKIIILWKWGWGQA